MEISNSDPNYKVWNDEETEIVFFEGSLRLGGPEEYKPIADLLKDVAERLENDKIIVNLEKLEFLNSSGISMLSKFTIWVRQKKTLKLEIIGSKKIPWQGKSLKNLKRLMPNVDLKFIDPSESGDKT